MNLPAASKTSDVPARLLQDSVFEHDPGPLVSVIIPCYNGEAFLEEAIESALAQTYRRVEVIVLDDGSTDRSPAIAHRYPVRYLRQYNRGLTETRNRGIRESNGDYIVFLDADDRLRPEGIEAGVCALRERPECAMVVGDHVFVSEDGRHLRDSHKDCIETAHYQALLKSNFIEMISSVLFRRDVLREVEGFDTKLRVAEDYELYMRIARKYPVCCHGSVVAEYRLHRTNASRNSALMLTMTLQVLNRQGPYVRSHPGLWLAFLEGARVWRKQYGRQLASELAYSPFTLRSHHLRRKLLLLGTHYPQGLLMFLLLRVSGGLRMKWQSGQPRQTKSLRVRPLALP